MTLCSIIIALSLLSFDKQFVCCFQERCGGLISLVRKDSSLSNEVFESFESDDFLRPETVVEESSPVMTTPIDEEKDGLESKINISKIKKINQTDSSNFNISSSKKTKISEDSADDGLGDSVAHGSSSMTDRSKLDSTEDTDLVYSPRQTNSSRGSCSTDKFGSLQMTDNAGCYEESNVHLPSSIMSLTAEDLTMHSSVEGDSEPSNDDVDYQGNEDFLSGHQTAVLLVEGSGVYCGVSFCLLF